MHTKVFGGAMSKCLQLAFKWSRKKKNISINETNAAIGLENKSVKHIISHLWDTWKKKNPFIYGWLTGQK